MEKMTIRAEVMTMALKDIFTMVKADRYTADGCEVLNKAREADVEDRRYNVGEISEKTGLQKTANGWVKPKNGKAAGAKKEESNPYKMTEAEKKESMKDPGTRLSQKYDAVLKTKKGTPEYDKAMSEYLAERDSYKESQGVEAAKKFPVDPLQGTESKPKTGKPADRPSHEQAYLDAFKDEKLKSDVKAAIKKYGATGNNLRNALYKNDKELSDKLEKMQPDFANQFIAEMQRENNNSGASDSAPRVLTGDTRIRVRKA